MESTAGWVKHPENPVFGNGVGTVFDVSVLKDEGKYRMWFSWKDRLSIGYTESDDGVHWSDPEAVLEPNPDTHWEEDINRPVVLRRPNAYRMWYTGQRWDGDKGLGSYIGHAYSHDGLRWHRTGDAPALSPDQPWEKNALMCPHVLYNERTGLYEMWYSGGDQDEPDAIGYATSGDGLMWTKDADNPVFKPDRDLHWESYKVTGCQVVRQGPWYVMFYLGFYDIDHAQIGVARSSDGVSNWDRHPLNPIIRQGAEGEWDMDACYKPFAIDEDNHWKLWYNGRRGDDERIGLAIHEGVELSWKG